VRTILERIGIVVFFLAWPAFYIYLRRSERTRIIIANGGKILMTRNWISDGKWSLPGGGLHKDEPVIAGAQRELREETGIDIDPRQLRFIGKQTYRKYGHAFVFHTFVAQNADATTLHRQKHEVSRMDWIEPSRLDSRNTSQDALMALNLWLHP
jgi:ADP-ribose pyrophosphatase YjhB (NUDIX family)